nr:DUF4283 domain protein [Tanacetum cinerariifolium]
MNVQHVNNHNHEQRNQGIPSKPSLNFHAVHKSYSSIFVSNIPWKATVQDLWDSCNQWGAVIDVYIAARRSKSGHRFGSIRFKNVNDINLLEERSRDCKPNEVGVSGNNDASNSGENLWGVSVESVKNSKLLNELFLELKDVSYDFIPDERCVWIDLAGLPLASWALEVYKKLGGRWGCSVFTNMAPNIESTEDKSVTDFLEMKDDEGPSLDGGSEHEEPLDVDNYDSVSSKDDNNGEIVGDSVLNNDGCVKDCMEKNLDDDVEKDIEDCYKNVTKKCRVVNNNMSSNVEGEILDDHFDGDRRNDTIEDNADVNPSTNVYLDVNQNTSIPKVVEDLSSLDRSSDNAERLAHHNNGLDDLDISLRNRLLHQDKFRVRPVAVVNDSALCLHLRPQ